MQIVTKRLRWMAIGATVSWFFDPLRGPERRARVADAASRSITTVRAVAARVGAQLPPRARARVAAVVAKLPQPTRARDHALRERIQHEVLDPDEAARLLIDVHERRVTVRGAVADADEVVDLTDRIQVVPDVLSVECRVYPEHH